MLLEDLKVIDLGRYIAGPFCARLFAAMGAEVIKVEKPGEGDVARREGPFPQDRPHPEKSGLFQYLNMGKRSVTLNLKEETGRQLLLRLVEEADVLVENLPPRVMPGLGLDYGVLKEVNPRLVMTSISNFGHTGPYRDYQATELGLAAMSGLMTQAGDWEHEPLKKGGNFAQYHGALNAFIATLCALFHREATGRGQHIDVSIAESIAAINGRIIKIYSYTGEVVGREGYAARAWPTSLYPCADGYVVFTPAMGREWWPDFLAMVKIPEMEQEKFRTPEGRAENADELDAYFLPWLVNRTMDEVFHTAQAHRIPCGYVCTAEGILHSEQLKARNFFLEVDHPLAGKLVLPAMPFKVSEGTLVNERAPLLGEHNEEVYCGRLGLSHEELVALRQRGIV